MAIDPRRAFGRPTVVGRGIKIDVIIDRHRAGESVAQLSADYELAGDVIEGVLRWGLDVARAARAGDLLSRRERRRTAGGGLG